MPIIIFLVVLELLIIAYCHSDFKQKSWVPFPLVYKSSWFGSCFASVKLDADFFLVKRFGWCHGANLGLEWFHSSTFVAARADFTIWFQVEDAALLL